MKPQGEHKYGESPPPGGSGVSRPTPKEQDEALEAVRGWLNGPSGPGFRVLRTLLWMAERGKK